MLFLRSYKSWYRLLATPGRSTWRFCHDRWHPLIPSWSLHKLSSSLRVMCLKNTSVRVTEMEESQVMIFTFFYCRCIYPLPGPRVAEHSKGVYFPPLWSILEDWGHQTSNKSHLGWQRSRCTAYCPYSALYLKLAAYAGRLILLTNYVSVAITKHRL